MQLLGVSLRNSGANQSLRATLMGLIKQEILNFSRRVVTFSQLGVGQK